MDNNRRRGFRNLAAKLSRFVDKQAKQTANVQATDAHKPLTAACTRLSDLELNVINKLFDELVHRSAGQQGIDRNTFKDYFQLPGLWGERLFNTIFLPNSQSADLVDYESFVQGLSLCCRGTKNERVGVLFKLFDLNDDGVVGRDELTAMLSSIPHLDIYLQSNKPVSRTHSKTTVLTELADHNVTQDDFLEVGHRSTSSDPVADIVSLGSVGESSENEAPASERPLEPVEESSESESSPGDDGELYMLGPGPSPMVTEMLARVRRDVEVETEINDLETLVSNILDQYDACGNDSLNLESFRLYVDHHHGILKLFSDCLREDVWSLKGHSLSRRQLSEAKMEIQKVENWIKVCQQFHKAAPKQAALQPVVTPSEADPACEKSFSDRSFGTVDVTSFLGFSVGDREAHAPRSTQACGTEINCPSCMAPLVMCPKCSGRYTTELVMENDQVVVTCTNCAKPNKNGTDGADAPSPRFSECWVCGFKFNNTLQSNNSEILMEGLLYTMANEALYFRLADRLLCYFESDSENVPAGFVFLEGCYVERVTLAAGEETRSTRSASASASAEGETHRYGFQILPENRVYFAVDEQARNQWVDVLRTVLNQKPINDLFDMHEVIGHGKFSIVYRATDRTPLGEQVAIKVVHKARMTKQEKELLGSEMNIMRMLRHPHVIYLKTVVLSRDSLYIVMEYVPGGELFEAINSQGPLPETAVHRLTVQLLKTLAYLHKSGIVHRDLKPENILLTSKNVQQADIKIADFGLSCLCGPKELLTQPCGTLVYAAPEVLTLKGYSHKVDVWSLGVVVYLMLCGKLPFPPLRNTQTLQQNLDQFYKLRYESSAAWQSVSPTCKDFLSKLLVVDPEQRLSSQAALNHIWIKNPMAVIGE